MCGIVGLAGETPYNLLNQLNQTQVHRGPDDYGEYCDPEARVALAMRRLSILDIAGGHQPMSNEDGTIWIVFNGEIYNSPELHPDLEAKGHSFRTSHSDTECLLHLYEDKGEAMLADLNGMFAFVVYDQKQRRLFGARDRFGIKPLYYARSIARFAFSSELKTLLLLPWVGRALNQQSLYHYLSLRYVPGPDSIFEDIHRVPPGHYFIYDLAAQSLTITRYWQPDISRREQHTVDEWSEIIREELRAAVRRWVLSDVPVACSLSGGLDSTSMVGLLAEMGYPQVRTYTVGFGQPEEAQWSELALARKVAERWEAEHHELILNPDDLLDDLISMVWALDEPYGGGLPSWYVFRFMSRDVKVGLTGSGGDEIFGGYGRWWRYERGLAGYRPSGVVSGLKWEAQRAATHLSEWLIGNERKKRFQEQFKSYARPMDGYWLYFDDTSKRRDVVSFTLDGIQNTADCLQILYEASGADNPRNGFAWVDMQNQLSEEFLLMTDRFSMAHSLEARVPFLDHVFVERMLSIPPEIRTQPDDLKYLLRRAVAPLLPSELLTAPKRGFVIPDTIWLRGKLRSLVERLLAPERLKQQGLLLPEAYKHFVRPHLDGRADFTGQVWTLLMFQLWYMVFVEEAASAAPGYSWQDLV